MASQEDSSVISNVIFFHATLAPIDGGASEEWLCLISIKERRRDGDEILLLFLRYFSMNMYGSEVQMTFFVTHAPRSGHDELCAIDYESWWLFWKKLRCRPSYLLEVKRTIVQDFAVVQGLKWPLGLNLNFTVLSLVSSLDDDALDPFKLEVW